MNRHLAQYQEHNMRELQKLTSRLRREYDDLRLSNKVRTKEMQTVTDELSHIEKLMSDDIGRRDAKHQELMSVQSECVALGSPELCKEGLFASPYPLHHLLSCCCSNRSES